MESSPGKFSSLRNLLVRALLFSILIIVARFTYIVTIAGESCSIGDFCFISLPKNLNFAGNYVNATPGEDWIKTVRFYSSVFQDLIKEGYLSPNSKSLCIETLTGDDVSALKEIGIPDSVGIFKKGLKKPFVIKGEAHRIPFDDNSFDFVFSGGGRLDVSRRPIDFATEIGRTLKPLGFAVVHVRARDRYSFDSFIDLFNCCKLVKSRDIDGVGFFYDDSMPLIREYVLKKESRNRVHENVHKNCSVLGFKHELVRDAEPLILDEPLKPWLTLKRNVKNIKYLPSMVDISFKNRYVYVDVGARSYGSSIGSWFKKQYPKQNKTFQVYAIEADQAFHDQYRLKKGVALLPYAAWVRNETLAFEINKDPGKENDEKGRGMGRIRPVRSSGDFDGEVNVIEGFDFADWLKNTVSEKDFVVVKMDVEGTEFELIPRLLETGAICLIDEMFLECHYNRWQRCCPGERSAKYEKTYSQCLELFTSLRQRGVLVHQWW